MPPMASPHTMGNPAIAQEFAWVDSALVVLDEWLSYRGGCLNIFDSNALS